MRDKNHGAVNMKLHSTESTPVEYLSTEECHLGPYNSQDTLRRFSAGRQRDCNAAENSWT